jgi:DNA-binding winged helix-turn-helix (wHTH) protein
MVRVVGSRQPSTALPTLVPGRDPLPERCPRPECRSGFILREEPLGPHQRGMLWCQTCSRSICWLLAAPEARSRERPRRSCAAGFERTAGCGPVCTQRYGHHAPTHEAYGRDAVYAEIAVRRTGQVRTGPLLIDFDAGSVSVDAHDVPISATEWGVLAYLASRLGALCGPADIVMAAWDTATAEHWALPHGRCSDRWSTLRMTVLRLRARLGPAGPLVETVIGRGYRLRAIEEES